MYKVLYVDDEPVLLEIAKIFLEKSKEFTLDITTSANEILKTDKIKSYDAIISDYQMPGMDGITFLKHVHTEFGDIPFIIFTGKGREDVVIAALNNGADFYLNKGLDPRSQFDELAQNIKRVVKRRQAREAIKNSERRLSNLINFLPEPTFAIDIDGKVIAWNNAIEKITGVQKTTIIGESDYIYAIPFFGKRQPMLLDLVLHEDKEAEKGYPFIQRNDDKLISEMYVPTLYGGKGATLCFIASPLYDTNGKITGAVEVVHDISEDKRAEQALKESEEQYRLLFERAPDAILLLEDTRFTRCNSRATDIFGCATKGEILGQSFIDFSPLMQPDRISSEQKGLEKISSAQRGIPQFFDWLFTHQDGTPFYAEVTLSQVTIEGKTLLQAIVRDVSKRKETEEILRKSERIYRDVVESEAELIARFLPDGTHIFVNDAYCRYFNKSRQDIIGKKLFPRIPQEDHREIRNHFASLDKEHPSASLAHRSIMPDGSIRWQRWSDRAIFDKNGKITEYQSVGQDITENKQTEEALALACQKMNLLSSITRHDILNQLTVLSGYLALSEEFTSDEKLLGFIKKEEIATERINQQIAFTKEYQDIGVHAPQWQNVHDGIINAANLLDLSPVSIQIGFNNIEVYADPLLGKVFYNLLDNAVKHGGKTSTIQFSSRQSGTRLTIICEDNGSGIDPEAKKHLFERGYGKHHGYGLFLIQEILAITRITIQETGEPGSGARFEITIPHGMYRFTPRKGVESERNGS
ncbi:MAG: PAS domain S-box protein [Methanoregula sp.]